MEEVREINWKQKYEDAVWEIEGLQMRLDDEYANHARRFNQWRSFQSSQFHLGRALRNILKHCKPHHKSEIQKKLFQKADLRLKEGGKLTGSLIQFNNN